MKHSAFSFCASILAWPIDLVAQPIIDNLTTWQQARMQLLDIDYDLSTSGRLTEELTLRVSRDGGETFEAVPATALSGDVGRGLFTDTDLTIVWDASTSGWAPAFYPNVQIELTVTVADGRKVERSPPPTN